MNLLNIINIYEFILLKTKNPEGLAEYSNGTVPA
jgi:hypothetical protein